MLETLREDYVPRAKAKGLASRVVLWKHTFRNALLTIIPVLGLEVGTLSATPGRHLINLVIGGWFQGDEAATTTSRLRDWTTWCARPCWCSRWSLVVNTRSTPTSLYGVVDPRVKRR